jgi:trans-aconitate methyltransferase
LNAKLLDVGAGTGFFTVKIAEKVNARLPKACFYAMDVTPAMLLSFVKRNTDVTPFVGVAEDIKGSVSHRSKYNRWYCKIYDRHTQWKCNMSFFS